MNYYNEWDKFAAEWLKELIKDGLIKAVSGGEQPCDFCGMLYNRELLGVYGCPDCYGEGLDCDD